MSVLAMNLIFLNVDFKNPDGILSTVFIFLLMLSIITLQKTEEGVIINYIAELDVKFKEEKNWKKLIEEL
jgi:hypothetical protein